MDWQAIEAARAFAERWQTGSWRVTDLPRLLGARVVLRDLDPVFLGATRQGRNGRYIYLHERLAGPAFSAVLAHECSHPFLDGGALSFCSGLHALHPYEVNTNVIASVLTVPLADVRDVHLDDGSAGATGDALCVPTQMVRVRRAAATVLGELPGRRDYALDRLGACCIGLAAYFGRLTTDLTSSDPLAPYYRPPKA